VGRTLLSDAFDFAFASRGSICLRTAANAAATKSKINPKDVGQECPTHTDPHLVLTSA